MKTRKGPFDFNVAEMTVEEVTERLRQSGINVGSWTSNEDYVSPEGEEVRIPTFQRYAAMLKELAGIMEDQVKKDVNQVDDLNYQLHRLRHGGGS